MNTRRPTPAMPSLADGMAEYSADRQQSPLWVRLAEFAQRPAVLTDWREDWATRRARDMRFTALAARLFRLPVGRLEDTLLAADPAGSAAWIATLIRQQAAKRHARRLAESAGISCWPLLMNASDRHGWDWRKAIPAAEAALAPRHGLYTGKDCRGGMDTQGHYGWCATQLRAAWRVAGCRDTGKFRLLVRSHAGWQVVKKGDSLPFARDMIRGWRWAHAWGLFYGLNACCGLSRNALAVLGRLSPELRHAAVRGVEMTARRVRIRDLNWTAVRQTQTLRADAAPRSRVLRLVALPARPAWALLDQQQPKGCRHPITDRDVAMLCPSYPAIPRDLAVRIGGGESPVSVSGNTLSRKEAHRWLDSGARLQPADWLADDAGIPRHRDLTVVRWLIACRADKNRWTAIQRTRTQIVAGQQQEYRALDILDEIQADDIPRPSASVDAVLRSAAQRQGESYAARHQHDYRVLANLPAWTRYVPARVRILRTPSALIAEGRDLNHCVGGYTHAVESGQSIIIALASRNGLDRSTIELDAKTLDVRQHKARRNASPSQRHAAYLAALLNRLNRSQARQSRRAA